MPKLCEQEIAERDAGRDLQAEIRHACADLKQGGGIGRIIQTDSAVRIRLNMNMSQAAFADLLGVSKRTVQQWEQGRRRPSGAARSLLKIAEKRPDVLRKELGAG
jgi:putative transcriptional regulator